MRSGNNTYIFISADLVLGSKIREHVELVFQNLGYLIQ